ncbi:MAG: hypothetical protein ABJA79_03510 [Parafilimonas sp.]
MVKKTSHIILFILTTIFASQLVLPAIFFVFLQKIKKEQHTFVTHHTNEKDFQTFIFTSDEFSMLKITDEGEFMFMDVLYDVQSIKQLKDKYIIYALADKTETKLMSANNKNINSSSLKIVFKSSVFLFLFCEAGTKNIFRSTLHLINYSRQSEYQFISKPYLKIVAPPPDAASLIPFIL